MVIAAVVVGLAPGIARADDVSAAAEAFATAQKLTLEGKPGEAADFYELADELAPSPQALRSAARSRYAAGHIAMAATDAADPEQPLMDALGEAVVASNRYEGADLAELRIRMTLITSVPSLQAHSMLRYAAWRAVVAEFAAGRLGTDADDLAPQAIGHAALGISMAAFQQWVRRPGSDLERLLREAYALLARGFDPAG